MRKIKLLIGVLAGFLIFNGLHADCMNGDEVAALFEEHKFVCLLRDLVAPMNDGEMTEEQESILYEQKSEIHNVLHESRIFDEEDAQDLFMVLLDGKDVTGDFDAIGEDFDADLEFHGMCAERLSSDEAFEKMLELIKEAKKLCVLEKEEL